MYRPSRVVPGWWCAVLWLAASAAAEEEVASPLRVAQCRATCLQKFAAARRGGGTACLQGPDCFMMEEMQVLLEEWGVSQETQEVFRVQNIDSSCLDGITELDINILIPEHRIRDRIKFRAGVANWKYDTKAIHCNTPSLDTSSIDSDFSLQLSPSLQTDTSHLQCWENCELLQSNYQVWGAVCKETDICFPGCREACRFHEETTLTPQQSQPVIHTKGEGIIRVSGALARWPPPAPRTVVSPPVPLVYVVMRRAAAGPWRQIIQTVSLATRVPSNNEGALLRVLVVDPQGLVTIYSPDETWSGRDTNLSDDDHHDRRWTLEEVSLIHQKVLVIGEIAWEPRTARGVYLVTWEVDGGGLKGNLFTDSTRVTLSLWPDTVYHIQVELVSRTPGVDNEKSDTMTIDTSRAQRVSTESVEDVKVADGDRLMSVLVSSMRGERVPERPGDSELILGSLTAISVFALAVAAAILWRRRRRGTFPGTNVYVGSSSVLRRKLVEEFVPAQGFQPVLRMPAAGAEVGGAEGGEGEATSGSGSDVVV